MKGVFVAKTRVIVTKTPVIVAKTRVIVAIKGGFCYRKKKKEKKRFPHTPLKENK